CQIASALATNGMTPGYLQILLFIALDPELVRCGKISAWYLFVCKIKTPLLNDTPVLVDLHHSPGAGNPIAAIRSESRTAASTRPAIHRTNARRSAAGSAGLRRDLAAAS
ncbi:MAG: hypothetical protein ACXVCO_17755, partial [Ktedonobacterales bacterium]